MREKIYTSLVVFNVLCAIGLSVIVYIQSTKINTLQEETKSAREAVKVVNKELSEYRELSAEGIVTTYEEMKRVVEVYDKNVGIYNKQIADLQEADQYIYSVLARILGR